MQVVWSLKKDFFYGQIIFVIGARVYCWGWDFKGIADWIRMFELFDESRFMLPRTDFEKIFVVSTKGSKFQFFIVFVNFYFWSWNFIYRVTSIF